jgi:signal transduction histidine kinase/CheY-like chemotaxis protein
VLLHFRQVLHRFLAVAVLAFCAFPAAAKDRPLVFLGDHNLAPYEFLEQGKPRGANVELAQAIGRVLGRPVEVRLQDWTQAQAALLSGEGDALTMLGRTPERERRYDFSQPTTPVSFALFVRADETSRFSGASFANQRIGVTRSGLPRDHFESHHPEAQLVFVDSLPEGMRALLRREVDAFAAQEWSSYYLLRELGIRGVAGLAPFNVRQGNIAVRRGDTALLKEMDHALSVLKQTGEFDRIIGNWSHTRVQLVSRSTLEAAAAAGAVGFVALLLLSGALFVMRRQKRALRESQMQLVLADHRKDEFLATLAHELRNPLAPISNAARILQMRGDPSPQAQAAQDVIVRQVTHLARLVDDLLDINRISTGKLELRKEPVDLNSVVSEAVEASRPAIDDAAHVLSLQLHPGPIWLEADRVRLAQVTMNLLTNAAKYMPPGGRIELSTGVEQGRAVVRVRDKGIGIPRDRLARIFDMFYQEDRSIARAQGGLGIGLWLTRRLVLMHGGSIEAHSAGEGSGSEFTVKLPVGAAPAVAPNAVQASSTPRRRILVVDDNRDGAETMALLLGEMGHHVEVALTGEQALRIGEAALPELVFLDIGMPGMDGFEVCRRLRATGWGRAATVVALTGWGAESDKAATRDAGFDAHLTKPASPRALAALAGGSPVSPENAPCVST